MSKARPSAVTILIAAYAALVLAVLGLTPLWLDEIQQLAMGRQSWDALIEWIQMNPGGSPLPYLEQRAIASILGNSVFVVRLPAALCSIAGAALFAALCTRFGIQSRAWATVLFLALPLQFRYALEARGYSQGLLCSLITLWLFLRARERGSLAAAAWFGLSVACGLYTHPLTILPVGGELLWLMGRRDAGRQTKRLILAAAVAGTLAFIPWYLPQRDTQQRFASLSYYFFSWRQLSPFRFLHEMSGGGYICTAALLAAAGVGLAQHRRVKDRPLLASMAAICLAGPIAIDVMVNYFFAARQLLFAAPALVLCAGGGIESLRRDRTWRWAGYAALTIFLAAAMVTDYRLATIPKDGISAQADLLATHAPTACIAISPPNHALYYVYLRPALQTRLCGENPGTPTVLAAISPYSTPEERAQLLKLLEANYDRTTSLKSGSGEVAEYTRR